MKALYKLAIVAIVVATLTGCFVLGVFNPSLGGTADAAGDATSEGTIITGSNAEESGSFDPTDASVQFTYAGITATLTQADNQTIIISFSNGTVDADANNTIPGLTVYNLTTNATSPDVYERATTPFSYTAVVTENDGDSEATLSLNLTGANTPIEIALDPTLLTANGGNRPLNQDGDATGGEAGDDAVFIYEAVGSPAGTATGDPRNPRSGVNYTTPGNPTATDTTFVVTNIYVTGVNASDEFSAAQLSTGFDLFQFNPDTLVWTDVATTDTYDANGGGAGVGELTMTLPAGDDVAAGEIFQIRTDEYNVAQDSDQVHFGFRQRATTEQDDPGQRYQRTDLLIEGGTGSYAEINTGSTNDGSSGGQYYIQVYFQNGTGDILESTLSNDSVRVFLDEDAEGTNVFQIFWDYFTVESGVDGANRIRFWFPENSGITGSDDWRLFVLPTVRDDATTPTDTTDDLPIIQDEAAEGAPYWTDSGDF